MNIQTIGSRIVILFLLTILLGSLYFIFQFEIPTGLLVTAAFPIMIRLPMSPLKEITTARGTFNVPWFLGINAEEISTWNQVDGPEVNGKSRNITLLTMKNGSTFDINLFEDEVTYILNQIAKIPYAHYDYSRHMERRDSFREALKPQVNKGLPPKSKASFIAPEAPLNDTSPADIDRVGPPSAHCTMCDSPVEDGQITVQMGNDRICWDCSESFHQAVSDAEENGEFEENPAIISFMQDFSRVNDKKQIADLMNSIQKKETPAKKQPKRTTKTEKPQPAAKKAAQATAAA